MLCVKENLINEVFCWPDKIQLLESFSAFLGRVF